MFKGLGNLANIAGMLKQAQTMGARMKEMQERLQRERVHGQSGGGMVQVEFTGTGDIVGLKLAPELLAHNDAEMMQDLIVAAVQDGLLKSRELNAREMADITGGMNLPGLDDLMGKASG